MVLNDFIDERLNFCSIQIFKSILVFAFIKTRVNTTRRLIDLRKEMLRAGLDAFLVPSGDSHQSEYIATADKRLKWISGFSGSSGFAAITKDKAALWTDGRSIDKTDIA